MFTIVKRLLLVLVLPLALTACASSQVSEVTPVFGGAKAGGYDQQVACSSVVDGAGCTLNTRHADGSVVMHGKVIKDSVKGKIAVGLGTAAPLKVLDYGIARDLQGRAACEGDGCGGPTFNIAGGQAQAVSQNDNRVQAGSTSSGGACGGRPCATVDDKDALY